MKAGLCPCRVALETVSVFVCVFIVGLLGSLSQGARGWSLAGRTLWPFVAIWLLTAGVPGIIPDKYDLTAAGLRP